MSATQLYICAKCGCPDIVVGKTELVLDAKSRKAACPNCKWEGMLSEAAGIYTTEKVYDIKAVSLLLLYVTTKHAAGPIAQALQFVGLVAADDHEGLNKIMRAVTEGMIREAFVAAAEHAALRLESKAPGILTPEQSAAMAENGVIKGEGIAVVNEAAVSRIEVKA